MTKTSPFHLRSRTTDDKNLPHIFSAQPSADVQQRSLHFWRGASGHRHAHTVHNLLDCPESDAGTYVLVRIEADGQRTPLRIGRTTSQHGSENLAEIRHHAARLGAREIHLHTPSKAPHDQLVVQWDLQAFLFGALVDEVWAGEEKAAVGA